MRIAIKENMNIENNSKNHSMTYLKGRLRRGLKFWGLLEGPVVDRSFEKYLDPFGKVHSIKSWEPIRGTCPYLCGYCDVPVLDKRQPFLEDEFIDFNLQKPTFVNIGYDTELFGPWIPDRWLEKILGHCRQYPETTFRFLTKNPARYHGFWNQFPNKTILGVSLESNRKYRFTKAPTPKQRVEAMTGLPLSRDRFVNIAPMMDFDMDEMISLIERVKPTWIFVYAEHFGHKIDKPSFEKAGELLRKLTKVAGFVMVEPIGICIGGTDPWAIPGQENILTVLED